ncbi:hypothetical protein [Marinobacter halophilus]|uniref:hypothetical protein n=1 Tax=Marinobacter halophilus TaxID=1323740 RepID=UPI0010573A30|nr:hypothetical protein [Marinobacter halophilus]GGC70774.1 hypothetical protein GCM10011362_18990 [Marinobacter halophilus]
MESVSGPITWAVAGLWSFISTQGPEFALSMVAILLAVWSGRQSSRHSALSVLPAFSAWADYPRDANRKCEIRLANKGFGPAIIEDTLVYYDGRRKEGFQFKSVEMAIEDAFGDYLERCYRVATGERGHAIGVDEVIPLAGFIVKPELLKLGDKAFGDKLKPMTVTIKYRDIYRRQWVFIVRNFVGFTFRVNSPAYYFWHRWMFRRYLK